MKKTFLLVLGTPRSGTTLLAAMIGCHDEVAMLNEDFGSAVRNLVGKRIMGNKLCVPNQIELTKRGAAWRRVFKRRGYLQYQPSSDLSIADYLSDRPCKLVATVREGNAVISSIMKRGEQPYKLAAYRWCRGIEVLHELNARRDVPLLLLSFDELVSEPEQAMRAVARHLDVPYQPEMLEGYAHTPIYNNKGIDASKAKRPRSEGADFNLESRYPEIYDKYQSLLRQCRERAGALQDVSSEA